MNLSPISIEPPLSIEARRIIERRDQLRELGLTVNVSEGTPCSSPWSAGVYQKLSLSYTREREFSPELLDYLKTDIQLSEAQIQELGTLAVYEPTR